MTRWCRFVLVALAVEAALPALAGAVEPKQANGAAGDPLAVEQALATLKSGDWILKWEAMSQLARWKTKEAVPALKAVLAGQDHPWVRGRALVALAELLGEEMLDQALTSSRDVYPELRAAAVEALGVVGSARGEPLITERLKDVEPSVRNAALVSYARLKRAAAWNTVAPRLTDADPASVRSAIRALTYVATPDAVQKMIDLAEHKDKSVRIEAALALSQARPPDAIPVLLTRMGKDEDLEARAAAQRALTAYDPKVLTPHLLDALRAGDKSLIQPALRLLALQPSTEACDEVAALIREPRAPYLEQAELFLGLLAAVDADRYQAVFARYLTHERADIRRRAIESLARCRNVDLFALLRDSITDKEQPIRYAAFEAIRKATKGAPQEGIVAYLADALQSKDGWTYQSAIRLLGERIAPAEFPKALAALGPFLGGTDTEIRKLAAKALSQTATDEAKRDIARAQGYLTDWKILGPFPNPGGRGYSIAYPPEQEIDFAKQYESYASGYGAAFTVTDGSCGGVRKKSLSITPPWKDGAVGTTTATFLLDLPAGKDPKLTFFLGFQDKPSNPEGAQFAISVDGKRVFEQPLKDTWQPGEVSLTDSAGKKVALDLTVDPLKAANGDRALVGEPAVVAGDQTLFDLTALANTALLRVSIPEKTKPLTWQTCRASRIDGVILLHDIMPAPTAQQLAYGVTDIDSPDERKARLSLETDDGFILWLNGVKVAERPNAGEQKVDLKLQPGRNRLLLKVCNNREWWQFAVRVTDPEGRRLGAAAGGK